MAISKFVLFKRKENFLVIGKRQVLLVADGWTVLFLFFSPKKIDVGGSFFKGIEIKLD